MSVGSVGLWTQSKDADGIYEYSVNALISHRTHNDFHVDCGMGILKIEPGATNTSLCGETARHSGVVEISLSYESVVGDS